MTIRWSAHEASAVGPRAECVCGWAQDAPSRTQAKRLIAAHIDERKTTAWRRRRADRYRPSSGPARDVVMPPPAPLAGQPDRGHA